jgi:hypothetical protein
VTLTRPLPNPAGTISEESLRRSPSPSAPVEESNLGPGLVTSRGPAAPITITFSFPGTLYVGAGASRLYMPRGGTILSVLASVGSAPVGSPIILDLNLNGTTIYTDQSGRPTIAAGQNTDLVNPSTVTTFATNSYFTLDVDAVGSSFAGADLVVSIEYLPAVL